MHKAARQAKQNLQLQKQDQLMLLVDKGRHTGAEQPSVKHIANEFLAESLSAELNDRLQ